MVNRTPNPLDLECQKGDAIFYTPIVHSSELEIASIELKKKVTDYFQNVAQLKDDRLLVLTAELLVENAVDSYLSAIMPTYEKELADNRDLTFSLKIAIAKELRFSPSKFFDGADTVRRVRNEFVHNLEIKTFEKLKPKLVKEMEAILTTYFPKKPLTDRTLREQFKSLALFTMVGINGYVMNVRSLNSFLRDDAFLEILGNFLNEREVKQKRTNHSKTPQKLDEAKSRKPNLAKTINDL